MLPQIKAPIYTMVIPSTGEKVNYTAFLVRDEKVLAIAIQDGTPAVITSTLKQIIRNCTFGTVNVDALSSFDIEYIFIQLRAKSKGNLVELQYVCKNEVDGKPCDTENSFSIDLEKINVDMEEAPERKIMLTDTVGIMMKYPTLDNVLDIQIALANKNVTAIYEKMSDFVECVFNGETVETKFSNQEFSEWLGTLEGKQFKKIEAFFQNLPTVKSKTTVCCSKCKNKEEIVLEGLSSFLA